MGTDIGRSTFRTKAGVLARSFVLLASCALCATSAAAASAASPPRPQPSTVEIARLLDDADKALKAGNLGLALIQLKNAVRLAPANGEAHTQLGVALLRSGQAAAAERELRQAQGNHGSAEIIMPALLSTMLRRSEFKELLAEFPEPAQTTQEKTAADVLSARAIAFQALGQAKEARAAMDRSLTLRRDSDGLVKSARLAEQQRDLALAGEHVDEALKLSPANEAAFSIRVLLTRQAGDSQEALAIANEFIKRVPESGAAKLLRIDLLIELKQNAAAEEDVDALLKQTPKSPYGHYYRGVLLARATDFKGAWTEMQELQPDFVQSNPSIAGMVASVAIANGNEDSASAILTTLVARYPEDRLARLQLASLQLARNAPQAALEALAPLKASDDPSAHALFAQAYITLGEFDQAIPSLEIAGSTANGDPLLKRELALLELQADQNDKAIQELRDLMQGDPTNAQLAAPLIAALGKMSKWDEALAVANNLAKQVPANPMAPFYRGQVFIARGNFSEASSEFSKALKLNPKFVPALYYRARLATMRGDLAGAKKDLELILSQNPTNMFSYISLSEIALQNNQQEEAVTILDRAIKAAPNDPTPRLALANYQVREGKLQDAQTTVSNLLQVSRNNPEGLALQGQIQLLRGQTVDAVKTFRAMATGNASSPDGYVLLARALYISKNRLAAEEAAKRAVEIAPDSSRVRKELIKIQISNGRGQAALDTARTYANAHAGPEADLLMTEVLLGLNRASDGEALLDKSLRTRPDSRVAARLSQIAMSSKNFRKASAVLTNWIAKNPNDFDMRMRYAGFLMDSGNLAAARKEYEALFKQHPDDVIILNNLGWLLQNDDPDRALSLSSRAVTIAPRSAEFADTLGWMKYQRRDHEGALSLLQRAHVLNSDNPSISYHLARALDATGKRAEAKALLQATLEKDQKFDGADEAVQLLARW